MLIGSSGRIVVSVLGLALCACGGDGGADADSGTLQLPSSAAAGSFAGAGAQAGKGGVSAPEAHVDGGWVTLDAGATLSDAAAASDAAAVEPPALGDDTCASLPAVTDYAAPGPFADATMVANVGPGGNYTLFRPDASLGKDGFKHPIASWGNGISTTPDQYKETLTLIATHGFVIVACNDTQAERACLSAGLDWLIEENDSGSLAGKLDVTREVTIGYSWGGGAAIDTANRPNVRAAVSLHGMPPRETNAFVDMHSPLLLYTSTGDTFVTAQEYVTPNYQASVVQTFYATLGDATAGHLYPIDKGAISCAASAFLGTCQSATEERAPTIAWLRLWACGDQGGKKFFYGDDCVLCKTPWVMPQRKAWQ